CINQALDVAGDFTPIELHVELEVQAQAAGIKIGRAYIGPGAIDGDEFGMIEVAPRAPYPAVVADDLVELGGHGIVDQAQVIAPRYDDVHDDAAPCRRVDGAEQYLIGQEVGRLDANMLLRHGKGAQ